MQHFHPIATSTIGSGAVVPAGVRSRRLTASDSAFFADHLRRLDGETRRLRFGAPVNDGFVERYAAATLAGTAYVRGLFVDGVLRGAAELHVDAKNKNGEGAFSLEAPFQSRGLGTLLFQAVLDAARNRGVETLTLNCLRENVRMQRIARRQGAEIAFDRGDVVARITRPHPDAGTLAREWSEAIGAVLSAPAGPQKAAA